MIKICEGCKNSFNAKRNKIRFCSKNCSNKHVKKNRKKKVRFCNFCSKEFYSRRKKKMCSSKCVKISKKNTPRFAKLSIEKIHKIIELKKLGMSFVKIGQQLGINPKYASAIASGKFHNNIKRDKIKNNREKLLSLPLELTLVQKEIVEGSLLGDGYITKEKNARFGKSHKQSHSEYLQYVFDVMMPFSKSVKTRTRKNKIRAKIKTELLESVEMRTVNHSIFTSLRNKWYPNGIKLVPRDIMLTPLVLAIWFCDDGSNHKNHHEAIIHTQGFSEEDINFLITKMYNLYQIQAKINYDGHKLPVIRIGASSYKNFINIIKPFVVFDCMKYKTIIHTYKRRNKNEHVRKCEK